MTGASSGIGREFVNQIPGFYKHLDEIWVTARRGERLRRSQTGSGGAYRCLCEDLCGRSGERSRLYKQILNQIGKSKPG
ncbi:MAG: hypothetical protein ACLUUO_08130 [Sellimonas intestinalis]